MPIDKKLCPAIASILFVSLFLNSCEIWWGLPSYHGWAPDEITPYRVFRGIAQMFSNGWHDKYPPFHFYVLTALYSPFTLLHKLNIVDIYTQPGYTMLFSIGRVLSVIMGTGTVLVVYLCGREIYDDKASLFAALITALNCTFVYYSKITNLEVPYIFWFTLSLLFYIRILKHHLIKDYLLFSITAVLSICTKDQAFALFVLPFLIIILHHQFSQKRNSKDISFISSLFDRKIVLAFLSAVIVFGVLHNLLFNLDGFIAHVGVITGADMVENYGPYPNSISGHLGMISQSLDHVRFSFGWPIFVICLLGVLKSFLQKHKTYLLLLVLVPGFSYYVFFVHIILLNKIRYLMPISILLAFFGGKFLSDLLNPRERFYQAKIVLVGVILIYTFLYSFSINVLMSNDSRYYVEAWMKDNIKDDSLVVGVSRTSYLPRFENLNWTKVGDKHQVGQHYSGPRYEVRSPRQKNAGLEQILEEMKPSYIVTSLDEGRPMDGAKAREFFSKLNGRNNGYKVILKYKSSPSKWNLLNLEGIQSNLDKINPEIKIFKRG